jgi:hypothetical protein
MRNGPSCAMGEHLFVRKSKDKNDSYVVGDLRGAHVREREARTLHRYLRAN